MSQVRGAPETTKVLAPTVVKEYTEYVVPPDVYDVIVGVPADIYLITTNDI
jgi:hypothetical protein